MARNKQFKGISLLLETIYERVWGQRQRYLAIPFPSIIELYARVKQFLFVMWRVVVIVDAITQ